MTIEVVQFLKIAFKIVVREVRHNEGEIRHNVEKFVIWWRGDSRLRDIYFDRRVVLQKLRLCRNIFTLRVSLGTAMTSHCPNKK